MPQPASRSATLLVVCAAHFLMPFMMSAVGVALPAIGREFGATALQLGLVETTYVLSASIFLLAMGRLGDLHGRRRIFQYGVIVFTLAGGSISLVRSIEALLVLRFLQGTGGAMIMATTLAMLTSVFPPGERGKALGIATATVYAGISCGPLLGGILVTELSWRWIFILCVPLGIATFLVTLAKLRGDWADARGEPFDWRGSLLYAGALLLLIGGAAHLDRGPWAWGAATAGLAGLGLFLAIEARTPYPILNIALLRDNRVFALSNLAALCNYAATFGVTFFLSLYLQYVKGLSARDAGSMLIIQPVVQALLSPWCGQLADRYPAARVATIGMALCAAGLAMAATLNAGSPFAVVIVMLALLGTGFALFSSPNASVIMGSVAPRHLGVASGLNSSMRSLGMMTSMSIITVIFAMLMAGEPVTRATQPQFLLSMRTALLVFCGLCGIGIFCSAARLKPAGRAA